MPETFPAPPKQADEFAALAEANGYQTKRRDSHGSQGLVQPMFWHEVTAWKGDVGAIVMWGIKRPDDYITSDVLTVGKWSLTGYPVAYARAEEYDLERWSQGHLRYLGNRDAVKTPYVRLESVADLKRLLQSVDAEKWIRDNIQGEV